MIQEQPSILFIDAYDSFTNNIISLLVTNLSCSVRVLHIDSPGLETDEALRCELRHYDAVVCGPGPGSPSNEKDIGLVRRIWTLSGDALIPVLGICLGFQSMCLAFGGNIQVLNEGLHGRVRKIQHVGEYQPHVGREYRKDIFEGVGALFATLYHSLYVRTSQNSMNKEQWNLNRWKPIFLGGQLIPLAWADSNPLDRDDRILMAARHESKPFWGLQYHPESICTNKQSITVIKNWFKLAQQWNKDHGRTINNDRINMLGQRPTLQSLLSKVENGRVGQHLSNGAKRKLATEALNLETVGMDCQYESQTLELPDHVTVPDLVEKLQDIRSDHIIFESTNACIEHVSATNVRGRYSIIGLDIEEALRIEYHAKKRWAKIIRPRFEGQISMPEDRVSIKPYGGIWSLLADFLDKRRVTNGNVNSPFWGGFLGFTTYELGLEGIGVDTGVNRVHNRPDLCFAWVTRSLIVDHVKKKIYIQQLVKSHLKGQDAWLDEIVSLLRPMLQSLTHPRKRKSSRSIADLIPKMGSKPVAIVPNNTVYESQVRHCQENIRRGDSYELCLTDQTEVILPCDYLIERTNMRLVGHGRAYRRENSSLSDLQSTAWLLYKSLRRRSPAPFASFIRLGSATFVSGSPERFLKWNADGHCELRPMKGTVKKTASVSTLAQAEALLQVEKEQAENLMIVDLVRHDLHGVCGPGKVTVPRLMVVEEYASVFQMITIVEGQIPHVDRDGSVPREGEKEIRTRYTGIDVLAASLPPGSMTGAPKKRSCEILLDVEGHHDRSLYSGVVGYMDVGGRGDFSVNIRCMFRWDDEGIRPGNEPIKDRLFQKTEHNDDHVRDVEVWHIGAGGAVTALSTAIAERQEMQTKLSATLGIFSLVDSG